MWQNLSKLGQTIVSAIKNIKRKHYAHVAAIILAALVLFWLGWVLLIPASGLASDQEVTISEGQGLYAIADTLKADHVISNSTMFVVYVALRGWERHLEAGDYVIPANSSLVEVAGELAQGLAKSNDIEVIIPEGSNIWEVDRKLTAAGFSTGAAFARKYVGHEGLLFPDTYRFKRNSTLDDIDQRLEQNFKIRTGTVGSVSQQTLIIASMLEKEARNEDDMRLVAGVIKNRLAKKMPLEIDATVSYGACLREFTANPFKDCQVNLVAVGTEVHIDSPFNSYTRAGLPPRPISNPGLEAVQAALNPAGDYLYYLSDRNGVMHFAHTAAEHAANRRKYLGL